MKLSSLSIVVLLAVGTNYGMQRARAISLAHENDDLKEAIEIGSKNWEKVVEKNKELKKKLSQQTLLLNKMQEERDTYRSSSFLLAQQICNQEKPAAWYIPTKRDIVLATFCFSVSILSKELYEYYLHYA